MHCAILMPAAILALLECQYCLNDAGLFDDEMEAAKAYDRSLVRLRGANAATNCALSDYATEAVQHGQAQVTIFKAFHVSLIRQPSSCLFPVQLYLPLSLSPHLPMLFSSSLPLFWCPETSNMVCSCANACKK